MRKTILSLSLAFTALPGFAETMNCKVSGIGATVWNRQLDKVILTFPENTILVVDRSNVVEGTVDGYAGTFAAIAGYPQGYIPLDLCQEP